LGRADNKRVRYLTSEELPRFMQALPGWLKPIVILARHTGLGRGNLLDLTWEQVNLSKRLIVINRTKNGEPIGIPLSETANKTLLELQRVRYLHSPFVFCDRDGKALCPFKVSVAFKRACKKAEVHDLRFHDLRHDFASNLVRSGVDICTVRELLGHRDLRMTVRYCHLAPENLRSAVSMLDARESGYSLVAVGENEKGCIAATP
jgi:integrase